MGVTHVYIPPRRGPLKARVVLADPATGEDLFVTAATDLRPGDSLAFTYPDRGIAVLDCTATRDMVGIDREGNLHD